MAFSRNWDTSYETSPSSSGNISSGDDRIREMKTDIRERIDIDHYMDESGTQADHGEHRKVTFHEPLTSDPTPGTDKGALYIKDVNSKAELVFQDEDDNVVQLTSQGGLAAEIQKVRADDATVSNFTSAAVVPYDDTIPQMTEGAEVLSLNITPKNTNDYLYVTVQVTVGADNAYAGGKFVIFAGRDGQSDCDAVFPVELAENKIHTYLFRYRIQAPSTSAITFKVRMGCASSSAHFTLNGVDNSRYYGGKVNSFIEITEKSS